MNEPSPSHSSLRGLDAVNLLLAGALSGFGPYVALFLAEQNWTQQNIGFVLTAGGFAGLLSQLPGGELLDAIRSKRLVVALGAITVAAGALIIATLAEFPAGVGRPGAPRDHRRIPGDGDCCHQPRPGRPRSAWQAARTQSAFHLATAARARRRRRISHDTFSESCS
jgi:MFS family permease